MKISLTASNVPRLLLVWVLNVAALWGVATGTLDSSSGLQQLPTFLERFATDPGVGWPYLGLITIVTVFNGAIPRTAKEFLVFWPKSRPGARAFSHFMDRDSTIDAKAIRERFDPLPSCPHQQNALWAGWLHQFEDDHRVRPGYRLYLFARDWTAITAATSVSALPLALAYAEDTATGLWYALFLIIQLAFARWLAGVRGEQLVMSVLSCKAASVAAEIEQLGDSPR